jgi:hypothetical protein
MNLTSQKTNQRKESIMYRKINIYVGLKDRHGKELLPETIQKAYGIVDHGFDGYTAYEAQGVWKGAHEKTLVFEIISDAAASERLAQEVAKELKFTLNQECVLLTCQALAVTFV